MSAHDEIGDLSGGQSHLWNGERRQAIVDVHEFDPKRSGFILQGDYSNLPQEALAAAIASEIYEDYTIFDSTPMGVVSYIAREILERALGKQSEKQLVAYFGSAVNVVPTVSAIGWLSHAFEAGITEADLLEWGIDPFVVIQLKWWQRRESESILNQQIRAIRNGWALPWLAAAVRDSYRNLFAFKDRFPEAWHTKWAAEIEQVVECFEFFGTGTKGDQKAEPETLSEANAEAWAKAFASVEITQIAPDARGRWAMLPKQGLSGGQLREPVYTVARYLQKLGHQPSDWPTAFDADFFGRIGDK
jgi:hypothetical protein